MNTNPIYEIRLAVVSALRQLEVACDHKAMTDQVADNLPDFFRQKLAVVGDDQEKPNSENTTGETIRLSRVFCRRLLSAMLGAARATEQPNDPANLPHDVLNNLHHSISDLEMTLRSTSSISGRVYPIEHEVIRKRIRELADEWYRYSSNGHDVLASSTLDDMIELIEANRP